MKTARVPLYLAVALMALSSCNSYKGELLKLAQQHYRTEVSVERLRINLLHTTVNLLEMEREGVVVWYPPEFEGKPDIVDVGQFSQVELMERGLTRTATVRRKVKKASEEDQDYIMYYGVRVNAEIEKILAEHGTPTTEVPILEPTEELLSLLHERWPGNRYGETYVDETWLIVTARSRVAEIEAVERKGDVVRARFTIAVEPTAAGHCLVNKGDLPTHSEVVLSFTKEFGEWKVLNYR